MEVAIWLLPGGALGWAGFSWAGLSAGRGMTISGVIDAATAQPGDFDPFLLFMPLTGAAGFLIVGNMIHNRFPG